MDTADYVLGHFSPEEETRLNPFLTRARDAVVTVLCEGLSPAMNQFNS